MRMVAFRDAHRDYPAVRRPPDRGKCFDQGMKEVTLRKYD